ncbi:SRPBCC domain-containing protein [Sphingomonas sp. NIBR02145]|uniref:SRPBCC family protein n=1 Tax=Sphingomonas sp. NIBR02145 TaxID=3014784 RepID=UPI0022B55B3B|nr:SRPBCC domain-containing protein [Sphingomonas sp. NIBR02145]WHU00842.1 SRPBCC domain-containing protein [Sphingomonas sp. NIBR02145]
MNANVGIGREVTIDRVFAAPRELVFDCMTRSEHLEKWWGPHGFDVPFCESDARPGGSVRIDMRGPEPYGTNPVQGEFEVVDRPERLVMVLRGFPGEDGSWGIEHRTTMVFTDAPEGGTRMQMSTVVLQVSEALLPALDGMREGWSQSFEKLETLLRQL